MADFLTTFAKLFQFIELWFIAFSLLGAFVGFVAGLLGVGGGAIMVPVLATIFLWMGIDRANIVHLALGTSMMAIILTSFASARAHFKHQAILWDLVKKIAPGIVLGTIIGVIFVNQINAKVLSIFFAFFVLIISFRLYNSTRSNESILTNKNTKNNEVMNRGKDVKACFSAGMVIGLVSALVSIGGGSLTVPYLVHYNVLIRYAIASSSAIGFVISITGTVVYFFLSISPSTNFAPVPGAVGYIYLPAALCIGFVSLLTAHWGAALAHRMPAKQLKRVFAGLLLILSINMLVTVFS